MMKEAYVSFEVAKLLKAKGFDEPCYLKYDGEGDLSFNHVGYINDEKPCDDFYVLAPTHQMAMVWLREEKNILIYVYPVIGLPVKNDDTFYWQWDGKKKRHNAPHIGDKHNYETFEDAVEAALKYALENLI